MGISYLAWLARIDFSYLTSNSQVNGSNPHEISLISPKKSDCSLYRIYNSKGGNIHFIAKKSPINFYGGGLQSGLSFTDDFDGTLNLEKGNDLHYSIRIGFRRGLLFYLKSLRRDSSWIILFGRQFFFKERSIKKALEFLTSYKSYVANYWKLSTQFDCKIEFDEFREGVFTYQLNLCDLNGRKEFSVGSRTVLVSNLGIQLSDNLMDWPDTLSKKDGLRLALNAQKHNPFDAKSPLNVNDRRGFEVKPGVSLLFTH
jgi:hypothetical protein